MNKQELAHYIKAGKISQEIRAYIIKIVKPEMKLVSLVTQIHAKIEELGGKAAFPVNLSIDDVAAHFHPATNDERVAQGLLKVDFGIAVQGCIADSAVSIDLTKDKKYGPLIAAAQAALENALDLLEKNPSLHDIGKVIQETIEKKGFSPIINLSGHSMAPYKIHAGITIPNYGNGNRATLPAGVYAIEPFATTGEGKIYSGEGGNIYELENIKQVRSPFARKVLQYILDEYKTLPFSLRVIEEKFGSMARLALRELEKNGVIQHHAMLIEKTHHPVSPAEHTFIKTSDGKIIVTTRD